MYRALDCCQPITTPDAGNAPPERSSEHSREAPQEADHAPRVRPPVGLGRGDLDLLIRKPALAIAHRWHMQRAEDVASWVRPQRLSELTVDEITAFFPRYAREEALTGGQFRQSLDALQLLPVDLAQSGSVWSVDGGFIRITAGRWLRRIQRGRARFRPRRRSRVPVGPSRKAVGALLAERSGTPRLLARLLR